MRFISTIVCVDNEAFSSMFSFLMDLDYYVFFLGVLVVRGIVDKFGSKFEKSEAG